VTHIEIRMACLKLALGDATPRTLEGATAHVAVAEAYARFLLGAGTTPGPADGIVNCPEDVRQNVQVKAGRVAGADTPLDLDDLFENGLGEALPGSAGLGHDNSSVGGVAALTVGSTGGVSNDPARGAA